jgi:hypothetical protein
MATSKKRRPAPTKDVLAPVDPTLKKRWLALAARLDALVTTDARAWDDLWEIADAIVSAEPPLYLFGGYKDAGEFFVQRMKVDRATGFRSVRVARYASPEEEKRYGVAKLDAALAYIEAKTGELAKPPLPIRFERLKIEIGRGKNARRVPLEEATVAELRAATRALAKAPRPASKSAEALLAALGKTGPLAEVRVTEHAGYVSFLRVPLAALRGFAACVSRAKMPGK